MRCREVIEVAGDTEISVATHKTGTIDVTLRDPQPDGTQKTLAFASADDLSRLADAVVAFLRRGDPRRAASAKSHREGVVIANEVSPPAQTYPIAVDDLSLGEIRVLDPDDPDVDIKGIAYAPGGGPGLTVARIGAALRADGWRVIDLHMVGDDVSGSVQREEGGA
jgi:hypothetical protein